MPTPTLQSAAAGQEEVRVRDLERERATRAAYLVKHRARISARNLAYAATYRAAHREEVAASRAVHRETHREQIAAYQAAWRASHREEQRSYDSSYAASHRTARREISRKANAKRRGAAICDHRACLTIGPAQLAWMTNEHVCWMCGSPVWEGHNLNMDHVVPVARGGIHCADNLRPACASCNRRKNAKLMAACELQPFSPLPLARRAAS